MINILFCFIWLYIFILSKNNTKSITLLIYMLNVCFRISKIKIPIVFIKPASYLIEWIYRVVFSHFGTCEPQILTPARVRYVTLNRTFSCNKAFEELGYKPIVTLQVLKLNSFSIVSIVFSTGVTYFYLKCS